MTDFGLIKQSPVPELSSSVKLRIKFFKVIQLKRIGHTIVYPGEVLIYFFVWRVPIPKKYMSTSPGKKIVDVPLKRISFSNSGTWCHSCEYSSP